MGRKRKELYWPDAPIPLIDSLLYAESDIRYEVNKARQEICLLSSCMSGNGGGHKSAISDKTAALAIKLSEIESLKAVTLPNGRTVTDPEKWLSVFDEVRRQARGENRPDLILRSWDWKYTGEGEKSIELYTIQGRCVSWIRWRVLEEARTRKLIGYENVDFLELVAAAAG